MELHFCGYLSREDPLYRYLREEILPRLGHSGDRPLKVYKLNGSNEVYLYEDQDTDLRVVGKFFTPKAGESRAPGLVLEREYQNLELLRQSGFSNYPHRVVRPLGRCPAINNVLMEEYCPGPTLAHFIKEAISRGEEAALHEKLTALAGFLARLHSLPASGDKVDFGPEQTYFVKVVRQLKDSALLSEGEAAEFLELGEAWAGRPEMWSGRKVVIHGDATPPNFIFEEGPQVTALDLERMRQADRAFDLGRVAGEIKHFFLQYTGNKTGAEPYIGRFLQAYAGAVPGGEGVNAALTGRLPFYVGLNELRIARNSWLDPGYRRRLIEEAKLTLKTFLQPY
ncbi:MAG: phosphotransferase [Bacillota bacterium]